MEILAIFMFTVFGILLVILIVQDIEVRRSALAMFIVVVVLAYSYFFSKVSDKDTAKAFLDGKPTYEKQYIINTSTQEVDSIYVRIKTN